ncbi:Somatostatin receptor type 4 [Trichoplax sp. H2]|nr:Somatostatin receptor type 4 [Trichoplax sp. H2]|eukprot:RDD37082.1 Somatostatin receptor type 4 [Trichoplax sp. H2]
MDKSVTTQQTESLTADYLSNLINIYLKLNVVIYVFIFCLTIATNLCMLSLIIFKKKFHCKSGWMKASMFFTGILFALLYLLPYRVLGTYWVNNAFICTILRLAGPALIISFNFHWTIINVDRYFYYFYPQYYNGYRANIIVVLSVAAIWLISLLCVVIPLYTFMYPLNEECINLYPSRFLSHFVYILIVFGLFFLIPLIIVLLLFSYILCKINHRNLRQQMIPSGDAQTAIFMRRINTKVVKHMAIMVGLFIIFWLPYIILSLMNTSGSSFSMTVAAILSQYFAFSYPAVNPILYACLTAHYRGEIHRLLLKRTALFIVKPR